MSSNNNNEQRKGSILGTVATFVVGAAAGAALAYFTSHEMETPHASHQRPPRSAPLSEDEKEEDEKQKEFCEICFRSYEQIRRSDIHIVTTPCGHVYCRECIDRAMDRNGLCPHCRSRVSPSGLRRIYL